MTGIFLYCKYLALDQELGTKTIAELNIFNFFAILKLCFLPIFLHIFRIQAIYKIVAKDKK